MSSTKFQDKRSMLKITCIPTPSDGLFKKKIKKTTHLKWYQKKYLGIDLTENYKSYTLKTLKNKNLKDDLTKSHIHESKDLNLLKQRYFPN